MGLIAEGAMYGPETVSARVVTESVLLLGGPRALLMQIARPEVAAGVAEHSGFEADPFGRLVRTLDAMNTIAFGAPEDAEETLAELRAVHERVRGELPDGTPYHANDPELLHWVHATLVDTVLEVERRYLGYLSAEERAAYYRESTRLARALGIPESCVPDDVRAFREYVRREVHTLEVGETARRLATEILHPRVPLVPQPLWEPLRLVTVDLLPEPLREGFGLGWDVHRDRLLRGSQAAARLLLPRVPRFVRNLPTRARLLAVAS